MSGRDIGRKSTDMYPLCDDIRAGHCGSQPYQANQVAEVDLVEIYMASGTKSRDKRTRLELLMSTKEVNSGYTP